jgi:hypothetical protein
MEHLAQRQVDILQVVEQEINQHLEVQLQGVLVEEDREQVLVDPQLREPQTQVEDQELLFVEMVQRVDLE